MTRTSKEPSKESTSLDVQLGKRDFDGELAVLVFDSAGRLIEQAPVTSGKVTLAIAPQRLMHSRLFVVPASTQEADAKPSLKSMARLGAYSPALRVDGKLIERIHVPPAIIEKWPLLCFCQVSGRVIKVGSRLPVCGARVHICEVDKLWRWVIRLPDPEIFRLRDRLLELLDLPRPPYPDPDPGPLSQMAVRSSIRDRIAINPQPEPPGLPIETRAKLMSSSVPLIRDVLVANPDWLRLVLCVWPIWWKYRCDEIRVVETDGLGRFETFIVYSCGGDKPDLYFWVEYQLGSVMETVYHPPVPCNTHWDYACGTEVTLEIKDARVPACDPEPEPEGLKVQIISIGRDVSLSEVQGGSGVVTADEGLTTTGEPFGGKLEPRVWLSRKELLARGIGYYRWSYRRLTRGDGTSLSVPGNWVQIDRRVVRHYAKLSGGQVTHVPYPLGPQPVGAEPNLFEIKPTPPAGGIEWTVVDEREDLASAHFETDVLGSGDTACERALDAAGKYELKLELFNTSGARINDWEAEGIDLEIADIAAPFGTDTVTPITAPEHHRIRSGGKTRAFRMVVHVDNNCCSVSVDPPSISGAKPFKCGFYEIGSTDASVTLGFSASHPNDFGTFSFSVVQGVITTVSCASVAGRCGVSPLPTSALCDPVDPSSSHEYTDSGSGHYSESFTAQELLGDCPRAAFSEALHVWTMAQDGYGRLQHLDAFAHAGFALSPPC